MKPLLPALLALTLLLMRAKAVDSVVVFNEINYHPAADETLQEWIELHNQMAIDIDLSAWHIEDGINFTFAEGTIIPGGGYLVIAINPAALQAATGLSNVLGPFTGSLANSGEKLQLRDRNDRLMDEMTYSDGGKWPLAADGSGATLAKRDPNSIGAAPENWTSSVVVGGTPAARNFPETSAIVRSLVSLGGTWRYESTGTNLGTAWKESAYNDTTWPGDNGATLISYWPFNGNATATRGTNGTFSGGVSTATDRNNSASSALSFNGSTGFVNVAGGGGLNAVASGTISLWAKWNASIQDADCCGSYGAVLARQSNGIFSNNVLALSTNNPATATLIWRQNSAGPPLINGTTLVGTAWKHIALTFSPTGTTLYLNGVAQGTATGTALNDAVGIPLTIGAWSGDGAGFMNGTLDDVAIWDQPLTTGQISQLAASTKTPLDFLGAQNAVYFSGNGMMAGKDPEDVPRAYYGRTH